MYSLKEAVTSTRKSYNDKILEVSNLLANAESIVCGIGAGLTSAGGIDYNNPKHLKKYYPQYFKLGFKTIFDVMSMFWKVNDENVLKYWAFWAHHINHVRYETTVMKPYENLYNLLKDKDYFICSTNVDGQLEKAGFSNDKIFSPQGSYAHFQCVEPCIDKIFYNHDLIQNMLKNKVDDYTIRKEDIPICPKCNDYLVPNLRCDNSFVEKPYMFNYNKYIDYLEDVINKKTVFLELGVGFNTPVIIRYPFEQMVSKNSNCTLVRINLNDITSFKDEGKIIILKEDLNKVLFDLV